MIRFSEWLMERTLYHGTIIDNLDSIQSLGLQGNVGQFRKTMYNELPEEEIPEIVFTADKKHIKAATTAMISHIGNKLNKDFHSVTDNDILNHGLLCVIKDGERYTQQHDGGEQHPYSAEPNDYYTDQLHTDYFIKGRSLIRFLRRINQLPRDWGFVNSDENLMRGELIKLAISVHPDKTKEEIIQKVQSLTIKDVKDHLRRLRS